MSVSGFPWRRRGRTADSAPDASHPPNGGRASLRTWLYRIATNACLDFLEKRRDHTPIPSDLHGAAGTDTEVLYLQPLPDSQPDDPHEHVVAKETIELAFIVAVQHLPARQRGSCATPTPLTCSRRTPSLGAVSALQASMGSVSTLSSCTSAT